VEKILSESEEKYCRNWTDPQLYMRDSELDGRSTRKEDSKYDVGTRGLLRVGIHQGWLKTQWDGRPFLSFREVKGCITPSRNALALI
jgi:hypothetical protein